MQPNFTKMSAGFLTALNKAIGPVLVASLQDEKQGIFRVDFAPTPYAESLSACASKELVALIGSVGKIYFDDKPTFNNSRSMWWF